jgi:hypothetical protein
VAANTLQVVYKEAEAAWCQAQQGDGAAAARTVRAAAQVGLAAVAACVKHMGTASRAPVAESDTADRERRLAAVRYCRQALHATAAWLATQPVEGVNAQRGEEHVAQRACEVVKATVAEVVMRMKGPGHPAGFGQVRVALAWLGAILAFSS